MADIYTRFRNEGDYYDITGTQPPTAFAEVPVSQAVTVQQGAGIPTAQRVLNVGRNDYNMQGTLEAARDYGIPPVMVQSSPYARTAYTYGPSGPIPLIGATSIYPHVVSSGRYDYGAPYMAQAFAMPNDGYSFDKLMAYARDLARMQMRRGGGSGSGGGTSKTPDKGKDQTTPAPTDDLALPPEGLVDPRLDIKAPMLRPDIPQLDLPAPLTGVPQKGTPAPSGSTPVPQSLTDMNEWEWSSLGGGSIPDMRVAPDTSERRGVLDWMLDSVRQMPRNVRPNRAAPALASSRSRVQVPVQSAYEPLTVDVSDWGIDYTDTLTRMLDELGSTGQAVPSIQGIGVRPLPAYQGPTIIRQPMSAW